jgi:hypothetical protein
MHGWHGEFPDHEALLEPFAAVEEQTSTRMQRIYAAALPIADLDELAAAVSTVSLTG